MSDEARKFPWRFYKRLLSWGFLGWFWMTLHYTTGIAGIIFASLAPVVSDPTSKALVSAGAVACTSLVTFLSARKTSYIFYQAWRALDLAKLKYEIDGTMTDKDILDIIAERERILEDSEHDTIRPVPKALEN